MEDMNLHLYHNHKLIYSVSALLLMLEFHATQEISPSPLIMQHLSPLLSVCLIMYDVMRQLLMIEARSGSMNAQYIIKIYNMSTSKDKVESIF